MKFFKIIGLLFLSLSLLACSNARYSTKKDNYIKQSKTAGHLIVPPGASIPMQKPYYVVPSSPTHLSAKPSLKPPGL